MSTPIPRPRCTVYVDGFNFYFGIFEKHPEWKWLNMERFFVDLRPLEEVSIKYFTAIVDEELSYSEAKFRQEKYLKALGTMPRIQIIKGKYQKKLVRCQAKCCEEYMVPREKKTDVNIAVHMIEDCIEGASESVVLVSGDSDLEPAVAWIHQRDPEIKITVYIPKLPDKHDDPSEKRRNDFYKSIGVDCRLLPINRLRTFQFDTAVKVAKGQFVQRPEEWELLVP
jgi:6-hydroxy-3-succinoylpyridine 3-monooxygenase